MTEQVHLAMQEGKDLNFCHRLQMPDGRIKHVDVVARATKNGAGQLEYVGAIMDTTEREQAAEALRASEHLARGQLGALMQMLEVLSEEGDPDQLPKHVVHTILTQLGAASVTVWQRNGDSLDLLGVDEEGQFRNRGEAAYFEGSIPVVGHAPPLWVEALQTGEHTVIEDIDKEPTRITLSDGRSAIWHQSDLTRPFAALKVHLSAQGVRGLLISPMLLAGQLAGIIGIRFKGARIFGREEIELTKALAHQAMLAIRLMRLSQQSRRAAVMAERNRLARDLHDTLAQGFTGVIVQLEAAEDAWSKALLPAAGEHVARARELARTSLQEARRSAHALRPQVLTEKNLCDAIKDLVICNTTGTGLKGHFKLSGQILPINCECEENLLRIAQEVLTNTLRHARARHFQVHLAFEPLGVRLEFKDDGCGYDVTSHTDGLGLTGISERVEAMGGRLEIQSSAEHGTCVVVTLSEPQTSTASPFSA